MIAVLFFYNLFIMSAYIFDGICFYVLYRKKQSRVYLFISIMFFLFMLDNLFFYMCEFLPGFSLFYESHAVMKGYISNIIGYFILFSYRLIIAAGDHKSIGRKEKGFWSILFLIYLTITYHYPSYRAEIGMRFLRCGLSILVFAIAFIERVLAVKVKKKEETPQDDKKPLFGTGFLFVSMVLQTLEAVEYGFAEFGIYILMDHRILFTEIIGGFYTLFGIIYIIQHLFISAQKVDEIIPPVRSTPDIHGLSEMYSLTKREEEVLELLAKGKSNAEIAEIMFISAGTVKTHVHNIYQKLGVNSRLQLVNFFERHNKGEH